MRKNNNKTTEVRKMCRKTNVYVYRGNFSLRNELVDSSFKDYCKQKSNKIHNVDR